MADPTLFGNWLNTTYESSEVIPRFPTWVEDTRNSINNLVDFLLGVMDLALAALEIVRAFAIGPLDPINALIDAIIAQVEEVLADLLKAGIYLTGDWYLVQPPFADLLGGFSAYQSRMAGRFTDQTDPTRPELSEQTPVFAMFLYESVDFSLVHKLVRFLTQMGNFFNLDLRRKTLQTPVDLRAEYSTVDGFTGIFESLAETFVQAGLDTAAAIELQQEEEEQLGTVTTRTTLPVTNIPDVARVSWSLSTPTQAGPTLPIPSPPPGGFLLEVSVVRGGLPVFYDRPVANIPQVPGGSGVMQEREVGEVLTAEGLPLVLFGGADQIELDGLGYNNAMKTEGEVKPGASRVFALRSVADSVPIPLEALKSGSSYLLQRTFFVSTKDIVGTLLSLVEPDFFQKTRYYGNLNLLDMPYEADFEILSDGTVQVIPESVYRPQTFFVRIASVTDSITTPTDFKYVLKDTSVNESGTALRAQYSFVDPGDAPEFQLSRGDRSELSEALEITFPADTTKVFLQQLTTALAILVLSRSDLEVWEGEVFQDGVAASATGLEAFAGLIPDILLTPNPNDFFELADEDSEFSDLHGFRESVLRGCERVASKIYRKLGTRQFESVLAANLEILTSFTWADAINVDVGAFAYEETILGSLDDFGNVPGISRNPEAAGLKVRRGTLVRVLGKEVYVRDRVPGFYEREDSGFTLGSVDRSPSLALAYPDNSIRLYYLRNIIPPEVYSAAAQILGAVTGPTLRPSADGAWLSLRLGQVIPGLEGFVDNIISWVRSLQDGSSTPVDAVLDYIDFLESRILETQALLNRIDALVANVITIQLPSLAVLFLQGNGTDNILSQFLDAGGPPQDGPGSYGGGVVFLGAGSPAFVNDFIVEMFAVGG